MDDRIHFTIGSIRSEPILQRTQFCHRGELFHDQIKYDLPFRANWIIANSSVFYGEVDSTKEEEIDIPDIIEIDPDDPMTWRNLRLAYYGTEQYEKAEQCRRTALSLEKEEKQQEYRRKKACTEDKYSLYQ